MTAPASGSNSPSAGIPSVVPYGPQPRSTPTASAPDAVYSPMGDFHGNFPGTPGAVAVSSMSSNPAGNGVGPRALAASPAPPALHKNS
jgi:hypothetical protein